MYARDRAVLALHYMQVDKRALAQAPLDLPLTPDEQEAQRRFYAYYGLPEHGVPAPLHPLALRDLAQARELPRWVLGQLSHHEIKQIEEVRRHDHR